MELIDNSWYDFKPVQFEIVKITARREFAFLKPSNIRALNLWKIDQLPQYFKLANYNEKKPNCYISVAKLQSIPIFTFQPAQRQKETSPWFKNEFFSEVFAYDLFMDFDKEDGEDWADLLLEVKTFKEWLEENKVPYYLLFSGNKGFQIIIPYEYLPEGLTFEVDDNGKGKEGSVYDFTKVFQEKAKEVFELKHLDLANNGIPNRLRKLPYSLVGDNVVLPLSDKDFEDWSTGKMHRDYVMRKIILKNRGLLLRDYGLNEKKLKEGFLSFIKEFGLK